MGGTKMKETVDKTVLSRSQTWFTIEDWLNRNRKVRYSIDKVKSLNCLLWSYIYLLEMGHKTCLIFFDRVTQTVIRVNSVVENSYYSQCCILIFFREMIVKNIIITLPMITSKPSKELVRSVRLCWSGFNPGTGLRPCARTGSHLNCTQR